MKRFDFNQSWQFVKMEAETTPTPVSLPHDAMLHEVRSPDCVNGKTTGYFPGGKYLYAKTFTVPPEWAENCAYLEFEGVYQNAVVRLNGEDLCRYPYGYTNFHVELTGQLHAGEQARIEVFVDNAGEPNTRWYSGSGIYRPVWLYVGEKSHIEIDGVQVTTISHNPAIVRVRTLATGGVPHITILRDNQVVASAEGNDVEIAISDAALWSDKTPNLYDCEVSLMENGIEADRETVRFGICHLEWSTKGLFVNGKETKLRGSCIHHDNGVLGACEYPAAALRRARILKGAGFNAIRSAHNPISRAMLDACDQVGVYVMDELCDMWYDHKNRYDYASCFEEWHTRDLAAMVRKDISHPSVVMYSIGNEVTETAEPSGITFTKEMAALCHKLDATRPVTCGINMALNVMHFAGMGVYKPAPGEPVRPPEPKNPKALAILAKMMEGRKAQAARAAGTPGAADTDGAGTAALGMQAEAGEKRDGKLVGSEYFNQMMVKMKEQQQNVVKQDIAKILSEAAFAALDIAGYNYAVTRYALDAEEYPERVSVGTETLPQKIFQNWQAVKECPYSMGDFIWTGWDYIGEAGIGAFCYDSVGTKDKDYPFLLAGCGVIDILGYPRPEVWLNKSVYGLTKAPYIGVEPLTHAHEEHIISAWRFSDAVHSWSWAGCEGRRAEIVVYCGAAQVELFQDGQSLGRKEPMECQAKFITDYQPGTLTAVAYDEEGRETGSDTLKTAGAETVLLVEADREAMTANGQDLCYLDIALTDKEGILKASEDREIAIAVEGAGNLAGFGSAAPCTEESYVGNRHTTYYGRVQAVVRAGTIPGIIRVTVSAPGCETVIREIEVTGGSSL